MKAGEAGRPSGGGIAGGGLAAVSPPTALETGSASGVLRELATAAREDGCVADGSRAETEEEGRRGEGDGCIASVDCGAAGVMVFASAEAGGGGSGSDASELSGRGVDVVGGNAEGAGVEPVIKSAAGAAAMAVAVAVAAAVAEAASAVVEAAGVAGVAVATSGAALVCAAAEAAAAQREAASATRRVKSAKSDGEPRWRRITWLVAPSMLDPSPRKSKREKRTWRWGNIHRDFMTALFPCSQERGATAFPFVYHYADVSCCLHRDHPWMCPWRSRAALLQPVMVWLHREHGVVRRTDSRSLVQGCLRARVRVLCRPLFSLMCTITQLCPFPPPPLPPRPPSLPPLPPSPPTPVSGALDGSSTDAACKATGLSASGVASTRRKRTNSPSFGSGADSCAASSASASEQGQRRGQGSEEGDWTKNLSRSNDDQQCSVADRKRTHKVIQKKPENLACGNASLGAKQL